MGSGWVVGSGVVGSENPTLFIPSTPLGVALFARLRCGALAVAGRYMAPFARRHFLYAA